MANVNVYSIDLLRPYLPDILDGIRPQLLVNLIKGEALSAERVMQGFRMKPSSMRLPLVRQRLLREIERSDALLDSTITAWAECNDMLWKRTTLSPIEDLRDSIPALTQEHGLIPLRIALLVDDRPDVRQLVNGVKDASPDPEEGRESKESAEVETVLKRVDGLSTEKRNLRARIRDLEKDARTFDLQVEDLRQKLAAADLELENRAAELEECRAQLARAEKVADRLRRANLSAEQEKLIVKRELKQVQKEAQFSTPTAPIEKPLPLANLSDGGDWIKVVSALTRAGKMEAALQFCEAFHEVEPESLKVHLALERIYARCEMANKQVDECLWISARMLSINQPIRACAFACRALGVEPTRHAAQVQLRNVVESIDLVEESLVVGARRLLARLKLSNALAYRQAHKIIKDMGRKYVLAYEGTHDILDIDKVFTLTDGERSMQTSPRRILDAIKTNEVVLAEFLRASLVNLKRARPSLYHGLLRTLEKRDSDCRAALTATDGPVVVDGSNVAWHDSAEKPTLSSIVRMQRDLWREGFFPVYIYVDASLPYQIDDEPALRALIDSGIVFPVDSGTAADEAIIRHARSLGCPVLTNDRMMEWDPTDEVQKLRFNIDSFGTTIYEG